ncbi:beta-glucosidase 24 [Ziziphus jujuba]|uniref:Beta-glucosidase 24 n=1 Tax=Ziziphus jujuba TaxID=326968 RepID=A0ABM3IK94_ZIZJJ|nr:beta-glucosidase 24 [Ziziphus jujuba]
MVMGSLPPSSSRVIQGSLFLFVVALINSSYADHKDQCIDIKKSDFPNDFALGVATAAAQIEGSTNKGGRGPSIWDEFIKKFPEKVKDKSNFSTALDSYNRYKEDVLILEKLGVKYYRFSISWTRILPQGSVSGGVNQEGIDHYNNLIDELIKHGITPFVTLFHFDFPQALQDKYGGFLSSRVVNDFKDYCEICFKAFGDRVKNWITVNEAYIIAFTGYDLGTSAPGRCSPPAGPAGPCVAGNSSTEPYIVSHNILLAHAEAVQIYREKFQKQQGGQIGITNVGQFVEPYSDSPDDIAAAERVLDFTLGWYVEPLVYGDYPKSMRDLVKERLPTFTEEQKNLVKGSFDFLGINYYTARYAKNIKKSEGLPRYSTDYLADVTAERDGVLIGPKPEGSDFIYYYPQGLQKLLEFMQQKYQHPTIYITENGITEANVENRTLKEALKDEHRISSIKSHLYYLLQAMENGVNVKGYFYWALFDDFEWGEGYVPRFGLYYIDYKKNLDRVPKNSAKWLESFLSSN